MSKWNCTMCKTQNNNHARYCTKCGNFKGGEILEQAAIYWKCPICKEDNHEHTKYCRKCGHWLLSEKFQPTKIEKGVKKTYNKPSNFNDYVPRRSKSPMKNVLFIIELCIIVLIAIMIIGSEQDAANIFYWAFLIHLIFSIIYVVKTLVGKGFTSSLKKLLLHIGILFGILMLAGVTESNASSTIDLTSEELANIKLLAQELNYEDLLRNANGAYLNTYVKLTGQVYHLENGGQKRIMINVSSELLGNDAVAIKRKEQDVTLILNDQIIVYGKVKGTKEVINILGMESSVPYIEGYIVELQK